MTVCIATFHSDTDGTPYIMAASDRKISLFGGFFSQENAIKFRSIHWDWIVMFAGNVEETDLMTKTITVAMAKLRKNDFNTVLECCRRAYAKQYRRLVETQILPEYDIKTYKEYLSLRKSDEAFFFEIRGIIREVGEDWNLLFAGFDDKRHPHVFVIDGPGRVQYCDQQQRGAIGSGAMAALMWLAYYNCPRDASIGWATFGLASAKFFAERARDVGTETVLSIFKPGERYAIVLPHNKIDELRQKWESINVVTPGIASDLDGFIKNQFAYFTAIQSVSQKSERAR